MNLLGERGILTRFQDELFGKGAKEYMSRRPYLFADTAKIKSWLSSARTAAGETRQAMVRDAVEVEAVEPLQLKGKAEKVAAYRLVSARGLDGHARRQDR